MVWRQKAMGVNVFMRAEEVKKEGRSKGRADKWQPDDFTHSQKYSQAHKFYWLTEFLRRAIIVWSVSQILAQHYTNLTGCEHKHEKQHERERREQWVK